MLENIMVFTVDAKMLRSINEIVALTCLIEKTALSKLALLKTERDVSNGHKVHSG